MEFNLQEMEEKELDKLVELISREKKRRKDKKVEAYFKEFTDLLERMKKDNITIEYETEYGFEELDECWIDGTILRTR